jgi:hypothetical protein
MKQQHLIILLLLTISSLGFQSCQNTPSFTKTGFESPLKEVEITFETRKIQAEAAQLVRLENGSSIQIPKDAFVDANGKKVTGKMDLGYRQFDDPADIIASGIPMTFKNEEGTTEQLESGGMFELRGSVGGEPVFVAPGKSIKTTLASSVVGAYDFYYLESDGAVETNSNSKWKKLTNTVDDIPASTFEAPDSFQLKYNIKEHPNLKPFEGLEWKLWEDNATRNPKSSANKGVLSEEWNRMEFSQPKMALKKTKAILGGTQSRISYAPDRTFFIADNNARIESYDMNGKLLASTNSVHEYSIVNFLSKDVFTYSNKDQNIVLTNKYLKTIAILENPYCLAYQEEKKQLYYLERNKDNYKSIFLTSLDSKGQQLFSIEFTLEDGEYTPMNKMFMTNDQKHLYLNVEAGVEVLDLEGKRVAFLEREETYNTIYYDFDNTKLNHYNWNYYYPGNYPKPSKNDVVTIVKKDGNLMIWDWKKDKKYTTKGVDIRDGKKESDYNITLRNNENYPFVTFREDGAKYTKTWYWEEDRMVENNLDNPYRGVSPMGKFVNIVAKADINKESGTFSGKITAYSGKEILSYKKASDGGEGPGIINYGQEEQFILVSIAQGDNILYDAKGNLIKDFTAYNSAVFYSFFNFDETLVYAYTLDGFITCWDLKGALLWETEVNELIVDPRYLLICDSSILITGDVNREYNLQGELMVDYSVHKNSSYYVIKGKTLQDNIILGGSNSFAEGVNFFAKKEALPNDPNIHQVTFYKDQKSFTTFIYLDAATKGMVDVYRAEQERLKIEELARKDVEMKLKRSFEIQSFGIYNWDRFYKDESETMVRCEAEFNLSTEYNDITVFLITGAEKNAVIEYTKETFEKFSFNTDYYNKLVAILPNNEIAVFENEDFKNLDIAKIKTAKKHQFEMKKMGGVAALEELKKMTAPPS